MTVKNRLRIDEPSDRDPIHRVEIDEDEDEEVDARLVDDDAAATNVDQGQVLEDEKHQVEAVLERVNDGDAVKGGHSHRLNRLVNRCQTLLEFFLP